MGGCSRHSPVARRCLFSLGGGREFFSLTAVPASRGLRGRALTGRRAFALASLRSVCLFSLTAVPLRGPPRGRAFARRPFGLASASPRLRSDTGMPRRIAPNRPKGGKRERAPAVRPRPRRPAKRISRERKKWAAIFLSPTLQHETPGAAYRPDFAFGPYGPGLRGALNGRDHVFWSSLPAPRARYLDRNPPGVFILKLAKASFRTSSPARGP